ncbi:hypothetical protein B4U45_17660 [Mycobacterium persicum]|uniref:Uncharacterized protein n=2 Tax=Mycobacterium persicum TaxID=1487726 RepID=A0A8E2LN65_9MYCO|nr:hypothetical protein A4G31_16645 [Mycobacterium persicum]ORB48058.1 hypothetical protein BST40_14465 [Mycobacterium persicum]ORB96134.1 hypothetical protein B1T44_18340 [Mycobacterium persicum]ORC02842.1 hypothetical protein B1T48_17860 [Mycobacterium persicum]ORC08151.1 hypothetical protein B4U45_17660 [Mycobacterium persicum]
MRPGRSPGHPRVSGTITASMLAVSGLPSWSFTTIERSIATLPPIEEVWATLPDTVATAQLKRRENLLGVATLSCPAIELLHLLISSLGIFHTIIRHPPSVKASTKQTLIAGGLDGSVLLVNKTMTVRLDNQHFLFTGAGDFTINRRLLHRVAAELGLAKRAVKDCRINPADYCPESELGLLKGIVSPFFSPSVAQPTLQGVVLIAPAEVDRAQAHMVAISLSPFESLVVRLADLPALVQHYAARAYPDLKRTTLGAQLGGVGGPRG